MKKSFAPVVLFCYNRLDYLQRTVAALQANRLASDSDLFIFSDGPKNDSDLPAVLAVRQFTHGISGFRTVCVRESERNNGLANSIVSGVTELVNRFGRIIVLEDDLVTSPFFLSFMNESLDLYADDEQVCCIHGYSPSVKGKLPRTYFLKGADCLGWATWSRAWAVFHQDIDQFINAFNDDKLRYELEFNGWYPYYQMLLDRKRGLNSSWAVCWLCSSFLAGKLCLYSGIVLVQHIGAHGAHSRSENSLTPPCSSENPCPVIKIPLAVSKETYRAHSAFYKEQYLRNAGVLVRWLGIVVPSPFFHFLRKLKQPLLLMVKRRK